MALKFPPLLSAETLSFGCPLLLTMADTVVNGPPVAAYPDQLLLWTVLPTPPRAAIGTVLDGLIMGPPGLLACEAGARGPCVAAAALPAANIEPATRAKPASGM